MTCPHCGFENLDTNTVCFRCGQEVDLTHVSVEPRRRRSGPWLERFLARWTRWRRPGGGTAWPALGAGLLSLFPGLGHLWLGEPGRAALALGLYAAAFLVAYGVDLPGLVDWVMEPRWLPVSVHAWVMADAYALRRRQGGARVPRGELLVVTLAALALLFLPAMVELGLPRGDEQVRLNMGLEAASLQPGDVLRLELGPVVRPRVGTVVVYPAAGGRMAGVVIAGPGSRVDWKAGALRVDTKPVPVPDYMDEVPDARITLGANDYLVLSAWVNPDTLHDLVLPTGSIEGVAVEVVEPPERRRILNTR